MQAFPLAEGAEAEGAEAEGAEAEGAEDFPFAKGTNVPKSAWQKQRKGLGATHSAATGRQLEVFFCLVPCDKFIKTAHHCDDSRMASPDEASHAVQNKIKKSLLKTLDYGAFKIDIYQKGEELAVFADEGPLSEEQMRELEGLAAVVPVALSISPTLRSMIQKTSAFQNTLLNIKGRAVDGNTCTHNLHDPTFLLNTANHLY